MDQQAQEVATNEREGYSLKRRLQGRTTRTGKHTVYLNEELGERHRELLAGAQAARRNVRRKIVFGDIVDPSTNEVLVTKSTDEEIAAIEAEAEEAAAAIQAKVDEVAEQMMRDSLYIEWRAVPKIVIKDARRKAIAALTKDGKRPNENSEEFKTWVVTYLLSKAITHFHDRAEGVILPSLDHAQVQDIDDYAPDQEVTRLIQAYNETQYEDAIAHEAIDDSDFSPAT